MDDDEDLPPDTAADRAVNEAVDHVVRIMDRLPPTDRDEVLDRLVTALHVLRDPKHGVPLERG